MQKGKWKVLIAVCVFLIGIVSSCKKEKETNVLFELHEAPEDWIVSSAGETSTYTVTSNGNWHIEPLDEVNWVKIEPTEGQGNGEFSVVVSKNTTLEERGLILTFVANGYRQDRVLKIKQEASTQEEIETEPFLYIDGDFSEMDVDEQGGSGRYTIRASGVWKVELSKEEDWARVEPMEGVGDGSIVVEVDQNETFDTRSMGLIFFLDGIRQEKSLTIYQEGVEEEEGVVFQEDFSWLDYGSAIFYTVTNETRIDNWSAEEKNKGWTSTVNTIEGSGNQPLVYARQGFVKLGKTSYGGDLISPKLEAVKGTQDLLVKFKAVPYQTAGGARDGTNLKVGVIGPGDVSVTEFTIDNWPDYNLDPQCTEIWKAPETERSFIITGATSETQIRFLGQDFDLRAPIDPNKNRIFLDDIIVTLHK